MSWHGEVVWVTNGVPPLKYHLIPHRQFRINDFEAALCGYTQFMVKARFVVSSEEILVEGGTLCEPCIRRAKRMTW